MLFLKINIASPLQFTLGGQFQSDQPWTHARRVIDTYELMIGVKGTLFMRQEDIHYELNPGEMLLLEPHRIHEGSQESAAGVAFDWLHFHCPSGASVIGEEHLVNELEHVESGSFLYLPFHIAIPMPDRVTILFTQLMHTAHARAYSSIAANYLLTSLLIELSTQAIQQIGGKGTGEKKNKQLARIMEWTRVNAEGKLHVQDVADYFNYNRDYLSRYFKQQTGIHLQEYIHQQKLVKAKELLSRSTLSIQEIAHKVGIQDDKYFMKLFKKVEGMTPSQYRHAFYETMLNKE